MRKSKKMTTAYDELYIGRARVTLGNMLHFAVYDLKKDISTFYQSFIDTELAKRFGKGEPKLTVGMSGAELAYEVIFKATGQYCDIKPTPCYDKTPEYWAGWALAYYEWNRNIPFEQINKTVPITDIIDLYHPLHEADITKFIDVMDARLKDVIRKSQLARLRLYAGLTQKMLAERSEVSVRMIEHYEQGRKDINQASAETIYKLSKALGCEMEELIEK